MLFSELLSKVSARTLILIKECILVECKPIPLIYVELLHGKNDVFEQDPRL